MNEFGGSVEVQNLCKMMKSYQIEIRAYVEGVEFESWIRERIGPSFVFDCFHHLCHL